jgi:hypothetical protein
MFTLALALALVLALAYCYNIKNLFFFIIFLSYTKYYDK